MPDTPDTLIRRWFEELWNQGREETIGRLLAPGAKMYGLTAHERAISRDEFRPFFRRFRTAFSDIRITILRTVTEGVLVAAHCLVRGTHLGDTLGTPATQRTVQFSGMCIARAADGQLVEGWNSFDSLTCCQQIGVLPQLPAPGDGKAG